MHYIANSSILIHHRTTAVDQLPLTRKLHWNNISRPYNVTSCAMENIAEKNRTDYGYLLFSVCLLRSAFQTHCSCIESFFHAVCWSALRTRLRPDHLFAIAQVTQVWIRKSPKCYDVPFPAQPFILLKAVFCSKTVSIQSIYLYLPAVVGVCI